jgi:hypothetical protein
MDADWTPSAYLGEEEEDVAFEAYKAQFEKKKRHFVCATYQAIPTYFWDVAVKRDDGTRILGGIFGAVR